METYSLSGGVQLHYLKTEHFKHFSLSVYIPRPLCAEEASKNALLTQVLQSACAAFPTKREIAAHLEWLYGASMHAGVKKKGEAQVLSFHFSGIGDSYAKGEEVSAKLAAFAKDVIFSPLVRDEAFDENIFRIEKEDLKNEIAALQNDKRDYANQRCLELMCNHEAYGIHELGSAEELDKITPKSLYEHYISILENSPIHVFVTGDLEPEPIMQLFDSVHATQNLPQTSAGILPQQVRTVHEAMDVAQGKMVIGLRSDTADSFAQFCRMQVFNSVYGSGTHSKLFNNVREKLSLAYYAYSGFVRQKNIVLVATGIEFQNYDKAKEEIFLQLEEIKKGNVSEKEMDSAKEFLKNRYLSCYDEPILLEDFYLNGILAGDTAYSVDDMICGIETVTKDQVIAAAQSIVPDLIYFICGKGETA